MDLNRVDRRVLILFYLLIFYITLQFVWWAYSLLRLMKELYGDSEVFSTKVWMVLGEGAVFIAFLLAGAYIMQRAIRKEMTLVRQQRNFLLSITHELKTPLAAIKLCIETLSKRKDLSSDQREPLERNALQSTERLHNLIDKVLLATRIENSSLESEEIRTPIILSQISEEVIEQFKITYPNIQITSNIEPDLQLSIDAVHFESIIGNLIENAIKYGDGEVEINLSKSRNGLVLCVSDNGSGIASEYRKRVFQKFYRIGNEDTRTQKGTGLGLYIVSKLVSMYNGTIRITDNQPTGTRFEIRF